MVTTHEATPLPDATPETKPKKAKKSKATVAATEAPATEPTLEASTTEQPAPEPSESKPTKVKPKKPSRGHAPDLTLQRLADIYIEHLTASGKSVGTATSYQLELDKAVKVLGADTKVATLTPDDVRRFNDSKEVMLLKSGKPKAAPSYLKSQRVLRLALVWAATKKWIESAPLPE